MQATIQLAIIAPSSSGIIINGFIMAVNLWDWTFRGNLNPSDYYISSVAFSNLTLQLWLGFTWFCDNGWNYDTFCQINFALMMISTHYSIVMAGCMCFFYCLKIVMFNHWLLQRCNRLYSESYRRFILQIILVCTVLGLPLVWFKKGEQSTDSDSPFLNISSFNNFYDREMERYYEAYKIFLLSFGYTCPLLVSCVSGSCIMVSLVQHMKRMRGTMEKHYEVLTDVHRRAALTVFSIIVLILMHFVTSVLLLNEVFPKRDLRAIVCEVIARLYAPTLGVVLVRGNAKLRSVTSKMKSKVLGTLKLLTCKRESQQVHII